MYSSQVWRIWKFINNLNSIQIKHHNIDKRFILSANRSMIHVRYIYFKCLRRSRCYFHKCHTRKHEKIFQSKKFYCIGRDMLVDNFLTLEYWSRCEIWNFNIGCFVCQVCIFCIKAYIFCCILLKVMSKHRTFKILIILLHFMNIYCVVSSNNFSATGINVIQCTEELGYFDNSRYRLEFVARSVASKNN